MSGPAANPLWAFSLDLYGRAGVAPACLALQDDTGADVNLVLFLLWCAATGRRLDAAAVAQADEQLAAWRDQVVAPLRRVRRAMKTGLLAGLDTEACRARVKAVELETERLTQDALWALAPAVTQGGATAAAIGTIAATYLDLYARHLGRALPGAPVGVLVDALPEQAA